MRFIGTFYKMKVGLFVCLMTRNISLSSTHSPQYSTDVLIPTMPRKNRICRRIFTYRTVTTVFIMSNSINCRVHLCQMQVRWEFLRDAKHFIAGPRAASSSISSRTSLGTLQPPCSSSLRYQRALKNGGTVSRE